MKNYLLILVVLFSSITWSQNHKFGKVSKAELEEKFYPLDSSANAAILYTERKTNFEFDKKKGFFIVEKYFVRIKIYNQAGYEKATKKILAYHNTKAKESVFGIKATTFNIENGKIIKTNLQKKDIFQEEENKYYYSYKFTMPYLKPGCVVEWKYTFSTPFFSNLNEVKLQEDIPIKNLNVRIATPEYYNYNAITKGFIQIPMKKDKVNRKVSYTDIVRSDGLGWTPTKSESVRNEFSYDEHIQTIKMSNIPAIKNEPFAGNINNYKSGINYELSYIKPPNEPLKTYATSWEAVVEKIYNNSAFGEQLKKNNHFEQDLQNLLQELNNTNEKIILIYQFVKNKIKWNGYDSFYSDEGVRKSYKEGVGNVADINLNLVAMLQHAGIDANPVLISTIDNGIPLFPTRKGFNYVIARVATPNGHILLDATDKNSGPNILPKRVLNFRGRVVKNNGESEWVELFPKKHSINKTLISAKFNESGFTGTSRKTITNNYLLDYRNAARDKSEESLLEWIDEKTEGVEVINARVSNLDNLEKDAIETIQFETESFYEDIADKTYISPLLYTQMTENPFKSENREFPVFFNKPWASATIINMSIPDIYTIENLPESIRFALPNEMGSFSYSISNQERKIEVISKLIINIPIVSVGHYQDLKEFYKKVITKQNEKIVLIKK